MSSPTQHNMPSKLSESLVRTIRERMQSKPSLELNQILEGRDEREWSPEAFEAIRQVLDERSRTGIEPAAEPPPPEPSEPPQASTDVAPETVVLPAVAGSLATAFRLFGVLEIVGGIILCALLWPGHSAAVSDAGIIAYVPALTWLLGGVIFGCLFLAIAEVLTYLRQIRDSLARKA